jgi:hypothetical protein
MDKLTDDNKYLLGVMILLVNLGSRHLVDEFSKDDNEYNRNIMLRRIAIFAVFFIGTRDLFVSFILTAAYILIANLHRMYYPEEMSNPEKEEERVVGVPAFDTDTPPLFKTDKGEIIFKKTKKDAK